MVVPSIPVSHHSDRSAASCVQEGAVGALLDGRAGLLGVLHPPWGAPRGYPLPNIPAGLDPLPGPLGSPPEMGQHHPELEWGTPRPASRLSQPMCPHLQLCPSVLLGPSWGR